MRAGRPSRTAEQNAAFRAAESARPPGVRLLNDPYAARLLPPGLRILAWISSVPMVGGGLNWFVDTRWPGARSSIIARTRLIDEWLCAAMRVGLEQVVILGAGFDSRAWRLPAVAHARVFEVDHPSTSAEKRRRQDVCRASGIAPEPGTSLLIRNFWRQKLRRTHPIQRDRSGSRLLQARACPLSGFQRPASLPVMMNFAPGWIEQLA